MAELGIKAAVITLIVLLVLVFVAQLVVGVFGTASGAINKTLVATAGTSGLPVSYAFTGSANAQNDTAANALTLTLSGSYSWISSTYPITLAVTGNQITAYASNTAYATSNAQITQTFTITSNASTQTLSATGGKYFNITNIKITGITGFANPSIKFAVGQSFTSVTHSSSPAAYSVNSISANNASTVGMTQAVAQFGSAGTANNTVVNFIPIVILVAVITIILALFGLRNLLNIEGEGEI